MTSEIPFTTGQDASGDVTDLTRPLSHLGHVEEWLAVFHELDAGRQRNDLLAVLRELRANPRHTREALDAVTALDQAWLPITLDLERSFRRSPASVTDHPDRYHRQMAEISLAFGEIYSGFALAISVQSKALAMPDSLLPKITALALFHLGKCAKFVYCKNEIPGNQLWERLHGLYTFAVDEGFATDAVTLFGSHSLTASSTQLWLRALMLATTSGAGLTPRQYYRAEEWLQDWCTRITIDRNFDETLHVYCVDVTTALGPQRIAAELKLTTPLYLGTQHLYQDLAATRSRMVADSMKSSLGLYAENPLREYFELLDRLQRIWLSAPSMVSRRASARIAAAPGEQVEVVRGFAALLAVATNEAEHRAHIKTLPVTDRSDRGYGLLFAADEASPPALRELIGARTPGDSGWQIGVIVRTTVLREGRGYSIGMNFMAHTAIPIAITKMAADGGAMLARHVLTTEQTGNGSEGEAAFYLIGDAARNRPDSLLAPVGAYETGDRLLVSAAINAFHIRINRVIQSGDDWQRTGFQVIEKTSRRN